MVATKEKPECSNLIKKAARDETYYFCDINDKPCLMEYGDTCEYYEKSRKCQRCGISEAIKLIEEELELVNEVNAPDLSAALQLGIGALKREQEHRCTQSIFEIVFLPGETEE